MQLEGFENVTQAHFHLGAPGEIGQPVHTITNLTVDGAYGTWTSTDLINPLTPALVFALENGNIYVNVHTTQFVDGEIRGQILSKKQKNKCCDNLY